MDSIQTNSHKPDNHILKSNVTIRCSTSCSTYSESLPLWIKVNKSSIISYENDTKEEIE